MKATHVLAIFALIFCTVMKGLAQTSSDGELDLACSMYIPPIGGVQDCAFGPWMSTYVFIGSISKITPIPNGEQRLEIIPEEVFRGQPENPLTVETFLGRCLPKLSVGDRWFFILLKQQGKPILLQHELISSRPVAEAQEQIQMLRRLQTIGDAGILQGNVQRESSILDGLAMPGVRVSFPPWPDDVGHESTTNVVPGARVRARRLSDNVEYESTTNADGEYEFPPVSPGRYALTVDRIGSFQADDSEVEMKAGACTM